MRALISAAIAAALLSPSSAAAQDSGGRQSRSQPPSCKPLPPVELKLQLQDNAPGKPAQFEAIVQSHLPVEDLVLDVQLPPGGRWTTARAELAGRLDANARRALPMGALLPTRGHAEIHATVRYRLVAGGTLTSGACLSFDDGQPTRPLAPRLSHWNGAPVIEYAAAGGGR